MAISNSSQSNPLPLSAGSYHCEVDIGHEMVLPGCEDHLLLVRQFSAMLDEDDLQLGQNDGPMRYAQLVTSKRAQKGFGTEDGLLGMAPRRRHAAPMAWRVALASGPSAMGPPCLEVRLGALPW